MRSIPQAEINTEARRIARGLIKIEMKSKGIKVAWVEVSQINKAVKALLASKSGPSIVREAKRNIQRYERIVQRIRRGK